MVKKIILFSFLFIGFATACKKDKKIPACIQKKVEEFKFSISCNVESNVKEYEFQSNRVFVFDPGTCGADMTSEVIDENCHLLGYLGGIAGNSKINGEDFNKATLIQSIWSR